MTFEIITYGAGPYLDNVFNGIAGIAKSDDYDTILNFAVLFAVVAVAYYSILKGNVVILSKWFLGYTLAYSLLFVPKAEVVIIDRIYGDTPRIVKNVPFGVASVAHFSSHIGDAITRLFESAFSSPDDVKYHRTGMMMASTMIEKTAFMPIADEKFSKNMRNFIHQCVVFEAIRGKKYTIDDLKKSNDIWGLVSKNASKAHAFPYNNEIITCYTGAQTLSKEWDEQIRKVKSIYSNRYYRSADTSQMASGLFLSHLPGAYNYLLGISRTAEEILHQQLMMQSIIDGVDSFASETGSAAALQQFAASRAKIQQHASYTIVGQLALEKLPLMRAIFECLLYGIFPIVFLLILLPQGGSICLLYIKSLFWVHSWGPIFALLNVFFSYAAKIATVSAATTSGGVGICLDTLPGIYDVNAKIAAFAGFMSSFIPILTWSIFKNGPGVLANMSASLFGINQSSAMAAAEEATTGNLRYGNTDLNNHSFNNLNANKYDTNASYSAGAFRMQGTDMVHYTSAPSGEIIADSSGAISRMGTHINEAETMRMITGQQSAISQQIASQQQVSFEERASASLAATAVLGKHLSEEMSSSTSFSTNEANAIAEYSKNSHEQVARQAHSEGKSDVMGDQKSLTKFIRGSVGVGGSGLLGIKGMIDLGAEANSRSYHDQSTSVADQVSNDLSDSSGNGRSQESSFRVLAEELQRRGDTYGANLAYRADAAFQDAQSSAISWQQSVGESQAWSELASQHKELSSSASFNWDQELLSRVAKIPAPGASEPMGEVQAAQVLNNPHLAKEYSAKAIKEMLDEKVKARVQGINLNQEKGKLDTMYQQKKVNLKDDFQQNANKIKNDYEELTGVL
ncbi:MAG: conjugal transfer protein TraG N-terminal domain-containing protein [Gammaproteobacteria bacterium]|jgi:conjugal transfer mating pair stabilization protein TraG|nr:conjugal transfer protein TraG N-terminal domain-containing protein [Gammaproteobacteria bacterium]